MSLFTRPLSEITFVDVQNFCTNYREGVRVEYKGEYPELPKTISAFANTMGGILLVGVKAKDGIALMPIIGIQKEIGIEERITQSSITGIYPPVLPDIRVIDVPNQTDKVVVIIRVNESLDAPHAIQNSTRVYIRTGSISQPYELAEIDRIEFLLKRRENSIQKKNDILRSAEKRRKIHFHDNGPSLEVTVIPALPYKPIVTLENLFTFAKNQRTPGFGGITPVRVLGGIVDPRIYIEMNDYGFVYYFSNLEQEMKQVQIPYKHDKESKPFLHFSELVYSPGRVLNLAQQFYKSCEYLGNVEVTITIRHIRNLSISYYDTPFIEYKYSLDNTATASRISLSYDSQNHLTNILPEILRQILWVFQLAPDDLDTRVKQILVANNLDN